MEESEQDSNQISIIGDINKAICIYTHLADNITQRKDERNKIFKILKKTKLPEITYQQMDYIWENLYENEDCQKLLNDISHYNSPYNNLKNENMKKQISSESTLEFNFSQKLTTDCIKLLSNFTIPVVKEIKFVHPKSIEENLDTFLINSVAKNQKTFSFLHRKYQIGIEGYFFYLRDAFSKFTENISINNFKITCSQFCSLVRAAKGVKRLMIQNCNLITDSKCDFGEMFGCKIQTLNLSSCGDKNQSNWIKNTTM